MSTDYGLLCNDCNVPWITDNISKDEAEEFIKNIHLLEQLGSAIKKMTVDIYLHTHFSASNDLNGLLDYSIAHHEHKLIVIDEYKYFELTGD